MNFLDGELERLESDRAAVVVHGETFEWNIAGVRRGPTGESVTVGFRPETMSLADGDTEKSADLGGEVSLLERIGDRLLAYVAGPEEEIRLTVDASDDISEGERLPIHIAKTICTSSTAAPASWSPGASERSR